MTTQNFPIIYDISTAFNNDSYQNSIHHFLNWIEEKHSTLFNQFINKSSEETDYLLENIQKLFDATSDEQKKDYQYFLDNEDNFKRANKLGIEPSISMPSGQLAEKIQVAIQSLQKNNCYKISKKSPLQLIKDSLEKWSDVYSIETNNHVFDSIPSENHSIFYDSKGDVEHHAIDGKLQTPKQFGQGGTDMGKLLKEVIENNIKNTKKNIMIVTDEKINPSTTSTSSPKKQ